MGRKKASTVLLSALLLVTVLSSALHITPLTAVAASTPPAVEWSQTYGSGSTDRAWSVQPTSDGGYIVFGSLGTDYWLVKTNSTGAMAWNNVYTTGFFAYGAALQTSDGGYILAATGSDDKGTHAWLVKTNSVGGMQWSKNYSSGIFTANEVRSIQQTRDGGYIIVGSTGNAGWDAWLFKIDSAGNMQWSKTYGGANEDFAHSVQQTSDGGYVFAGYIWNYAARTSDFWFVKTNAVGAVEWSQIYEKGAALSVQQANDGGYIVAGYTSPNRDDILAEDAWVIKTNSTGGLQWSKTIGGTNQNEFWSVGLTSGGGYILCGVNVGIVKMNSTGGVEWNQTYGGSHAYSVQQTHDGGYIAAGIAPSPVRQRDADLWLMKLEADLKDTDGDGLLDDWEKNGIDYNNDGIVDLNLPALGADWRHKDIFVEVDYMTGHYPFARATEDVASAFANAPVDNPDGITGIQLHIEVDEPMPHQDFVKEDFTKDFDSLKNLYFGTAAQRSGANSRNVLDAKKLVYRYCIFACRISKFNGTQWVTTNYAGLGEWPGNDFIVAMGGFPAAQGTPEDHAAAFMHELGHNLGLHHGGGDAINYKPNYLSIMNYAFAFPGLVPWRPLDYSRRKLPALQEGGLNEPLGIQHSGFWQYTLWNDSKRAVNALANGPLDWNGNGDWYDLLVRVNINNFPVWQYASDEMELLEGYDDWDNLKLKIGNTENFLDAVHISMSGEEITSDTVEAMRTSRLAKHEVGVYNVSSPSPVWSQGSALSVNFVLGNLGGSDESVNVTLYANTTAIASSTLTAKAGNLTTVTLPYSGQALTPGSYTLKAVVSPVAQESYTADNTATGSIITVAEVIPEFPPAAMLAVLVVLSLTVSLAFKRKTKP